MTSGQCLEARQLLGLTQAALARKLKVPQAVISAFERTGRMPRPLYAKRDRLAELRAVLENFGIEFTDGDELRVRLQKAEQ